MALILNIETATQVCSVALSEHGSLLALREQNDKNSHALVLTDFIEQVMAETGFALSQLDAIAVSMGPGSYTGLRIGVSTAKGLCYSLDKPLLAVGTIESLALYTRQILGETFKGNTLICPMIDARLMEVYSAFFNHKMDQLSAVKPLILQDDSFAKELENHQIILSGDGSLKCTELFANNKNVEIHPEILCSALGMISKSDELFSQNRFEDIAYFEPFYLKEFIAGMPNVKGLR